MIEIQELKKKLKSIEMTLVPAVYNVHNLKHVASINHAHNNAHRRLPHDHLKYSVKRTKIMKMQHDNESNKQSNIPTKSPKITRKLFIILFMLSFIPYFLPESQKPEMYKVNTPTEEERLRSLLYR